MTLKPYTVTGKASPDLPADCHYPAAYTTPEYYNSIFSKTQLILHFRKQFIQYRNTVYISTRNEFSGKTTCYILIKYTGI